MPLGESVSAPARQPAVSGSHPVVPACTRVGPEHGGYCCHRAGRTVAGRTGHTDGRVRRRIAGTGRAWLKNMGEDLPVIFPAQAELAVTDQSTTS